MNTIEFLDRGGGGGPATDIYFDHCPVDPSTLQHIHHCVHQLQPQMVDMEIFIMFRYASKWISSYLKVEREYKKKNLICKS